MLVTVLVRACLVALLLLAHGIPASAGEAFDSEAARATIAQADRLDLAGDPQWLKLIHYRRSSFFRDAYQSDILTESFFLATGGQRDPKEELHRTIEALLTPVGEKPNEHPQCRFPARLAWLQTRLTWPETAPVASCPEFERWSRSGNITSIRVIFASGHLSNPASFYGHLLVKFNSANEQVTEDLLETTLNYGAIIPDDENSVSYILNGLLGGYRSTFTQLEFFQHNHNYAEVQLRDLWEYELDLTAAEVDLIVRHSWEVLGKENRYYFILQNCAYRVADLLNLVIEEPLLPSKWWSTPIDVFVRLAETAPGERNLIRGVTRFPSRQNRFREAFQRLDQTERDLLTRIVTGQTRDVEDSIRTLSAPSQVRIIETLLSYYTFLQARLGETPEGLEEQERAVLLARLTRPPSAVPDELGQPNPAQQPHTGNRSSLAQASFAYNSELGSGVEYRFRMVYSDFLSRTPGSLPNSELSMMDVRILHRSGHIGLRWLDLVKITTLNVSETGLPNDGGGSAWKAAFGAGTLKLGDDSNLIAYLEGGYGKAWRLGERAVLFTLAKARATAFDDENSYVQGGAEGGLVFGGSDVWKAYVSAGVWQQIDGAGRTIPFARLETRIGASSTWDIRTAVEYQSGYAQQNVVETRLSLSLYW